ncbi:hypothetical protein GCM10017559_43310 [Streptosporangium longisporum]|uniref:Uncharacterized protein n=1 Tax=Streptosporangium longisporum TaxID=46187 RepID=A0ABN3Y7L8_9ACTN
MSTDGPQTGARSCWGWSSGADGAASSRLFGHAAPSRWRLGGPGAQVAGDYIDVLTRPRPVYAMHDCVRLENHAAGVTNGPRPWAVTMHRSAYDADALTQSVVVMGRGIAAMLHRTITVVAAGRHVRHRAAVSRIS